MSKRLGGIAALIWVFNLLALFGLVALLYFSGVLSAAARSESPPDAALISRAGEPTRTPWPTVTPVPPPTRRATITPWPTPSPGPSVTPMDMSAANRRAIGYSVEGRPLEVFRFGSGPVSKLIVAGIHGGYEYNTVRLADEFIGYLNDHPEAIPSDTSLYILRNLNPDGSARAMGVDGRANANNVDLNRNWPYNWKKEWNRSGCWIWRPIEGGEYAGSEPEVKALIAYIDRIQPIALISYHSAALGIFAGGVPDFPPSIRLAEEVAEVTNYPWPPIDTGCDYTGNLTDWAANTRSIASIDIELTNHRDTDFVQNLRVLQVFLAWRP
ncbi:MAG: M14 family metallopeptidase [Anaerolineales bacterium]